jgi:hypothetical protein
MIKLLDRFSDWILFQPFVRRLYQGIELEWLRKVPLSLPLLRHVMNAIQVMEDFLMKQEGFSTNMNHIWSDHRFFLSEKLLVNWMTLGMLSDISLSDEQRMGMHIVEKFIGLLEKAIADGETKDQIQCFSHAYGLNMLVNTLASSFVFQRRERQNLKNRLDAISHFLAKALILDTNNRDSCGEVGMRYDALAVESQTDGVWIRTQRLQVVDRKVVLLGEMIESSVGASSECEVRLQPTFAQAVDSFMHTMIVEENEDQRVDEFWSMIWRYLDWEFAGDIGLLCQALLLKSAQHDRARRMIRSILSDLLVQVQTNQHGSPLWKWLFGCMRTYESMTSASRPNHWNLWWKIMCDMDLLTAIKISLSTSTWSVVDLDVLQTHIVYSMSHVHLTADPSGNISGYVLEFCMELAVLSMSKIGRSHRMEDPFIEKICSQFESEVELVTSSWNHLNKMDHLLQKWLKTLKHVQVRWKKSIISKKLFDKIISSLSGTMSKMSKIE